MVRSLADRTLQLRLRERAPAVDRVAAKRRRRVVADRLQGRRRLDAILGEPPAEVRWRGRIGLTAVQIAIVAVEERLVCQVPVDGARWQSVPKQPDLLVWALPLGVSVILSV